MPDDAVARAAAASRPGVGRGAPQRDEGTATVELALVLPFIAMVLIGMVTSGFVLVRQLALESAARDAARSGAVIAYDDPPEGQTWVEAVEGLARAAAGDEIGGGTVCVALVNGATGLPVEPSLTTVAGGGPCFAEAPSEDLRVQVLLQAPATIDAAFFAIDVVIETRGSARYELPRPL